MKKIVNFFHWLFRSLGLKRKLASDVAEEFITVHYRGIYISFTRVEKVAWDAMTRKQKSETWLENKKAYKKGQIEAVEINGKILVRKK